MTFWPLTSNFSVEWGFISEILQSIHNSISTLFSDSEWSNVKIEGVSLPDALWSWSKSLPDAVSTNLEISSVLIQTKHRSLFNEVLSNADNNGQR